MEIAIAMSPDDYRAHTSGAGREGGFRYSGSFAGRNIEKIYALGGLEGSLEAAVLACFAGPRRPEHVLVVSGFGTGLGITSNTTAAMNSLPSHWVDHAAALRSVSRQIFGAIGTAVLAALLVQTLGAVSPDGLDAMPPPDELQAAYNQVFQVCAAILAAGAVLALFVPGRATAREHLAMRAKEAEEEAAALDEYAPL